MFGPHWWLAATTIIWVELFVKYNQSLSSSSKSPTTHRSLAAHVDFKTQDCRNQITSKTRRTAEPQTTMAGAFLMASLLQKVSSLIPQAFSATTSEQELHELRRIMTKIHDVLDDAEERDATDKYSQQLRLRELKEVALDAEDVIDEYEYEVLRAQVEARRYLLATGNKHAGDQVFNLNLNHPKVSISYQLARRAKEIKERFERITYEWERISLQPNDGKRRRVEVWKPTETTSIFDDANTFGREEEKRKIIEWLLREDEQSNVSVLPIVGMGGIGKTTVAQMVCKEEIVHQKFRLMGWVCVSQDSDIAVLLRKIILSFSSIEVDYNTSEIELHKILRDTLKQGDSFLVLDDVWNQKSELWDRLKAILVGVGVRKIIVTTRNESVAEIMQTTPPIYLGNLSFDNCWLLFTKIALEVRHQRVRDEFVDIGKKIVKKCGGLPLAVKVLASTLSYEQDEEAWMDTLESKLWELDDEKSHILPALKLSYDRMPMELRSCFMYLSLFPKDSHLERTTIIKQWMSQGFLHGAQENVEEEDTGNAYYDELLQRSIIQCYVRMSKEIFIMHDLIHDLAQSVARDHYLVITSDKLHSIPKTIRHVSIYLNGNTRLKNLEHLFESQLRKERLRTLILHSDSFEGLLIANLLRDLTCLRTLILKERQDPWGEKKQTELLDSMGNVLKHLRYLDLETNRFVLESLCKLHHLQTFMGSRSDKISLGCIGDLVNMRHLEGYDSDLLPREVAWLTNLQTLLNFTVGAESWRCKLGDLKHLDSIRGRFFVKGLETVKWSDVSPGEELLKTKTGIEDLYIWWGESTTDRQKIDENGGDDDGKLRGEQVLECLQPHPNLAELSIRGYPGAMFPSWLADASFKLQDLHLSGGNCKSLPALGQLPSLKRLIIMRMENVECIGRELLCDPLNRAAAAATAAREADNCSSNCCFPSLVELTFREMEEWVEWHGVEDADFPCLRLLCIENCPKLQRLPSLPSLTELTFYFHGWNSELLSDSCRLPELRTLKIIYHTGASLSFPDYQILRSLEELDISMSMSLSSVTGLGNLTSLRHLAIGGCPSLRIPPEELLPPGLKDVQILGCPEAEKWYHHHQQVCHCELKMLIAKR